MNAFFKKITILLLFSVLPAPLTVRAVDASHYAASSRLATGRWVKVKVGATGMHIVTDAQMRTLGFTDPSKVHVYGLGGRQLDFGLTADTPDDLPLIPSVRTSKGILFFAVDNVTWSSNSSASATVPFTHSYHQYSNNCYYFLSDIDLDAEDAEMPAATAASPAATGEITLFTERLLHESELETVAESGSQVWGEDFRTKKKQTFSLSLPDMADDSAIVKVRFGAKTIGSPSSILLTANGEELPATSSDRISDCKATSYGRVTETVKSISGLDGSLELGIEYSYSGLIYKANLDFIEAYYTRRLKLRDGELHFYLNMTAGKTVAVSGCSAATQIWEVTDPVHPKRVEYTLTGDVASFGYASAGYREFVAFDPETVGRTVSGAGSVPNQDIHALPTPDMVIITLPEYRTGADKIAQVHETYDGMRVHVLEVEQIYNEFSGGKPDAGAFRRMLKMWYDRGADADGHAIGYALLMGKPLNDNKMLNSETRTAGFTPLLIWESYESYEESESYPNDSWLGMLADVTDARFSMKAAKMQVAVGRIPCASAKQAETIASKIESYVARPSLGSWRNKVMVIADDEDGGEHLRQAQEVYNAMRGKGDGADFLYDRVYLDAYPRVMSAIGPTYPAAKEKMLGNFNDGVLFTNYVGHASQTSWGHEHLWEWTEIQAMSNAYLPFIYASTCSFAFFDTLSECGAENLLFNPSGGMIGMIAATRTVYISMNGELNRRTMTDLFDRAADGGHLRWGDVFMRGQNKSTDSNALRYALIGDPALRIPGGTRKVSISSIEASSLSESGIPELEAMSKAVVTGEILNADGTPAADFNGTVSLHLYDGERVVTTYGHGNGNVDTYNDRDKRLSSTTALVKDGKWTATLRVPPEIQGLYTRALISAYAWSDSGMEANGAYEELYVYGYNMDSADVDGPVIEEFYVNNPALGPDPLVSPNMMVFARLRDESGINVSETGIGHTLTLCIDGKDYAENVAAYFTQDIEDPDLGYLAFPLNDVTPGRHTLTLSAWDNANNVSKAELTLEVGAALDPVILDITASTNTATASVDFRLTIDRPNSDMQCDMAIYDLSGRRLWTSAGQVNSGTDSVITTQWNLCDSGGRRVPRGIYIYRARVETADGMYSSKSKKIAVTGEQPAN